MIFFVVWFIPRCGSCPGATCDHDPSTATWLRSETISSHGRGAACLILFVSTLGRRSTSPTTERLADARKVRKVQGMTFATSFGGRDSALENRAGSSLAWYISASRPSWQNRLWKPEAFGSLDWSCGRLKECKWDHDKLHRIIGEVWRHGVLVQIWNMFVPRSGVFDVCRCMNVAHVLAQLRFPSRSQSKHVDGYCDRVSRGRRGKKTRTR